MLPVRARSSPLGLLRLFSLLTALSSAINAAFVDRWYQWLGVEARLHPRVAARGAAGFERFCGRFDWIAFEELDLLRHHASSLTFSCVALLAATLCLLRATRGSPIERTRVIVRVPDVPRGVPEVSTWPSREERAPRIEARFATGFAWLVVALLPALWIGVERQLPTFVWCSVGRSCDGARMVPNVSHVVAWWTGTALTFVALAVIIERARRAIHESPRSP
jgi:hypothetical protein